METLSCFLHFVPGTKVARAGIQQGSNHCHTAPRESASLVVPDNTEKGTVDVEATIILNETQFSEFVQEEFHVSAGRADHFRQRPLRYFGEHSWIPGTRFAGPKKTEVNLRITLRIQYSHC
jgi:hypothetical protein